jgi:hypothetical protein
MDSMTLSQFARKKSTWLLGLFLSLAFLAFFASLAKTYVAEIEIIANAKSEIAAESQEQIVGNLTEIPRTLSFYKRLLKNNPDVRDFSVGNSPEQKKKSWNRILSIEPLNEHSSIIKISITTGRESDANQLVQKTARTFFDVAGNYYDIKNDLDLRIIDGPISRTAIPNWPWLIVVSFFLGFSTTFILQSFSEKAENLFAGTQDIFAAKNFFDFKKKTTQQSEQEIKSLEDLHISEQTEASYIPKEKSVITEKSPNQKIEEMKRLTKMIQQDKYPNFPEMPVREVKKAGAPENLPVADENFNIIPTEKTEPIHREPSAEELRERLNKLLRGEM